MWSTVSAAGPGFGLYPCRGLWENVEIFLALSQHPACHMHFTIASQLESVGGLSPGSFPEKGGGLFQASTLKQLN